VLCTGYAGVKEFHFGKLLPHGQNMKSGRRHSSQVLFWLSNVFIYLVFKCLRIPC